VTANGCLDFDASGTDLDWSGSGCESGDCDFDCGQTVTGRRRRPGVAGRETCCDSEALWKPHHR